jgi:hypothetical protein
MAIHVTLVPPTSGEPHGRYTEQYLADFINTTVPLSGTLVQILDRNANFILVWKAGY